MDTVEPLEVNQLQTHMYISDNHFKRFWHTQASSTLGKLCSEQSNINIPRNLYFAIFLHSSKFLLTSNTKFNCSTVKQFLSPTLELYPDCSGLPCLSPQSVFLAQTALGYLFQSLAVTDF